MWKMNENDGKPFSDLEATVAMKYKQWSDMLVKHVKNNQQKQNSVAFGDGFVSKWLAQQLDVAGLSEHLVCFFPQLLTHTPKSNRRWVQKCSSAKGTDHTTKLSTFGFNTFKHIKTIHFCGMRCQYVLASSSSHISAIIIAVGSKLGHIEGWTWQKKWKRHETATFGRLEIIFDLPFIGGLILRPKDMKQCPRKPNYVIACFKGLFTLDIQWLPKGSCARSFKFVAATLWKARQAVEILLTSLPLGWRTGLLENWHKHSQHVLT